MPCTVFTYCATFLNQFHTHRFKVGGCGGCCQQPPDILFGIRPPGVTWTGGGLFHITNSCPEVVLHLPFSLKLCNLKEQLLSSDDEELDDIVY